MSSLATWQPRLITLRSFANSRTVIQYEAIDVESPPR